MRESAHQESAGASDGQSDRGTYCGMAPTYRASSSELIGVTA
jgi:hypothetical protein